MKSFGKGITKYLKPFMPNYSDYHMQDQYRLAVALKCRQYCHENAVETITAEMVEEFHDSIDALEHSAIRKFVQGQINKQIIDMFNDLHESQTSNAKLVNDLHSSEKSEEEELARKWTANNDRIKFALSIEPSKQAGGGDGVFVRTPKSLVPGTVICLYPGLVHLKEHLKKKENLTSLLPDPEFMLMVRTDQSIIDGRTVDKVPKNPFGLAHKINHCGDTARPNVLQAPYDFPEDILEAYRFPLHLRKYIPNSYAIQPTMTGKLELFGCLMKGLVMVSCKHIEDGDELLMDYKLNPDAKDLPSWYRTYDLEDARMRWGQKAEKLV